MLPIAGEELLQQGVPGNEVVDVAMIRPLLSVGF